MINVGGYLEYRGVFSTVGDIMSTVGVILSTVGDVQYRGGYHDARGDIMSTVEGVQYRGGKSQLLFEYPTVLNTPTVLHTHYTGCHFHQEAFGQNFHFFSYKIAFLPFKTYLYQIFWLEFEISASELTPVPNFSSTGYNKRI